MYLRPGGDTETVVVADSEGRYEFTGLDGGNYALWAGPAENRATHLPQVAGGTRAGFFVGVRRPTIKVEPGQRRSGEDLALTRSLAIEGRVVNQLDEPLAEVEVLVIPLSGGSPALVHTDDRGEYRAYGLEPGRYLVRARPDHGNVDVAPNDEPRQMPTWHPASLSKDGAAEVVLATREATGIDIRIQAARTYVVSGTITDAAGDLVDGGKVTALPVMPDRASPVRMNAVVLSGESSTIVRAGRFTVRGVFPGRYHVVAEAYLPHLMRPGAPTRRGRKSFLGARCQG